MTRLKKEILNSCIASKNGMAVRESIFSKRHPDEYKGILQIDFPENFSFIQKLYHWLNDDFNLSLGICPTCGNRCKFINLSNGYYAHCCVRCADLDKNVYIKKQQACLKKYGDKTFNNRRKTKETCLEKYGVENVFQSDEVKEKLKETKRQKYGNPYFTNRKKNNKTVKDRYGVENISQIDTVKEKVKNTNLNRYGVTCTLLADTVKEKTYATCIEKYGVYNYSKSVMRAKKESERFSHVHDLYMKTGLKQSNGISKLELDFYNYLEMQFGSDDILTQYMSDVYPFKCDFYLKSIDAYIELNAHWTHGRHPFDEKDNNDVNTLNKWKSKQSKYYEIAVNVWSVNDVKKRETAHENKLNYIELFSSNLNDIIEELNSKIMKLKSI